MDSVQGEARPNFSAGGDQPTSQPAREPPFTGRWSHPRRLGAACLVLAVVLVRVVAVQLVQVPTALASLPEPGGVSCMHAGATQAGVRQQAAFKG